MYLKTISDRDQQPVCLEFLFKILRVMFFPSNMLNWYFVINELSLPLYFHHSSVHYSALGLTYQVLKCCGLMHKGSGVLK